MQPGSPSPNQHLLTCTFRLRRDVQEVRFLCTVHNRGRVSLVIPEEHALRLSMHPVLDDHELTVACRVELEKKGASGWWNIPEGTAVYEKSPYLSKFVETRNCYLAMWLPQLLMRHFIRNEASILGAEQAESGAS